MSNPSTTSIQNVSAPVEPAASHPATGADRPLIQAVKAIDPVEIFGADREITFVIDRQTQRVLVRVIDRKTGQIVNQIPPEYVLHLAEKSKGR